MTVILTKFAVSGSFSSCSQADEALCTKFTSHEKTGTKNWLVGDVFKPSRLCFRAVTRMIRNGFIGGTIRFVMGWLSIRMIGRFKGQSIFCPNRGDVLKYALGDGNTRSRSREPLAAELLSCHAAKRLPSRSWASGSGRRHPLFRRHQLARPGIISDQQER
jgi:hypothetical protein